MLELEPDEIPIMRVGRYHVGTPNEREWTTADFDEMAAMYDPVNEHRAPLTLDHKQDGPAFGWGGRLRRVGDFLVAKGEKVHAALREAYRSGAYERVSPEVYMNYKGTGKKYLKAITFLGSMIPEQKGLPAAAFADTSGAWESFDESGTQPEAGNEYTPVALRDLLEQAMEGSRLGTVSKLTFSNLQRVAKSNLSTREKIAEARRLVSEAFDITTSKEDGTDMMTAEQLQAAMTAAMTPFAESVKTLGGQVAALTTELAEVKKTAEGAGQRVETFAANQTNADVIQFAAAEFAAGRIVPAQSMDEYVAFCTQLAGQTYTVKDKDGKDRTVNAFEFYKGLRAMSPGARVPLQKFSESTTPSDFAMQRTAKAIGDDAIDGTLSFTEQAQAYAKKNNVPLDEAMILLDAGTGAYRDIIAREQKGE